MRIVDVTTLQDIGQTGRGPWLLGNASVPLLRELVEKADPWPRGFEIFACGDGTFGESLDHAIGQCFAHGADCVLSLRGDCPAITTDDVQRGFRKLHEHEERQDRGIVIAPNHRMGVSIVGLTREARFTHEGVFGNPAPTGSCPPIPPRPPRRGFPSLACRRCPMSTRWTTSSTRPCSYRP